MKIKKIRLRNINSFQGEHTIDFGIQPLFGAGLFAIVGPTGAGKSTLLDAVTLALFNRIPRFDKISKNAISAAGMILTRGERECMIEVEYSCKKGNFTSKWGISLTRNNTFNDYAMELAYTATGELMPLKKGDVPDKNQELIGLSYDQFVKSIMLSQGEFARFLKSSKDERGKLMEDITGMQIYRKLGAKAFEVYKQKGENLEKQIERKALFQKQQIKAEDLAEKVILEQTLAKEIAQVEADVKLVGNQISLKKEITALQKQIEDQQKVLAAALVTKNIFEEKNKARLKNHDRAEPFREEVLALENDLKMYQKLQDDCQKEADTLATTTEYLKHTIEQIGILCGKDCISETALEALTTYRREVLEKQENLKLKQNDLTSVQNNVKEALAIVNMADLQTISPIKIDDNALKLVENIGKNTKLKIAELTVSIDLKPGQLPSDLLDEILRKIPLFEKLERQLESYTSKKKEIEKETESQKEQQKKADEYQAPLTEIADKIKDIEKNIEQLRKQKDKVQQAYNFEKDRAKLLKKEEPCPLCGSLEHPYLSHYANDYVEIDLALQNNEKELKTKQKQQNEWIASQKVAIGLVQKSIESLKYWNEEMATISVQINQQKIDLELEKIGNRQWVIAQIDALQAHKKDCEQLIKNSQTIVQLTDLYKKMNVAKRFQNECGQQSNELRNLYAGQDIQKESGMWEQRLTELNSNSKTQQGRIQAFYQDIEKQRPIIGNQKKAVEEKIQQAGFESILQLKSQFLQPQEAAQLRQEAQEIMGIVEKSKTIITTHQNSLDSKKQDDSGGDIEALNEKEKELQENKKTKNTQLVEVSALIVNQTALSKGIAELEGEIEKEKKNSLKWKLLNDYIGDREGKKFSTFAQGLTLKQLIGLANERLKGLTDRYLLDKPSDDDDDLMVRDLYMGNEQRTVKTLSGGETFLVSLSLALALSDLASRQVRLESLFIDEGFGTLDPETLEVALATLEKLQQQDNKSIGIISHVESIKQRITTQIHIEKNNRGFSKISIAS